MNLILHLVKKDFRQTWMWILAVSLSLAGLGWSAYMNFHAPPADRNLWANALVGLAAATLVSTAVFLAMLVHSESLCGARAHWLGRPIDWRYLLAAKSLLATAATALPLVFGMAVYLAAEGFPPTEHLPAIARRTAIVLTVWVLPLAILATVTNNLQQMALWLISLFVTFLLAAALLHGRDGDSNIASLALVAVLGTAIAIWQYATRGARIARIALAAGVPLFLALQGMSPAPRRPPPRPHSRLTLPAPSPTTPVETTITRATFSSPSASPASEIQNSPRSALLTSSKSTPPATAWPRSISSPPHSAAPAPATTTGSKSPSIPPSPTATSRTPSTSASARR